MRNAFTVLIFAAATFIFSPAACADAIDGKWCNGAKQFTIDGPTITMPSGNQHQGSYDRHGFDYVVPDSEEGAGDRVRMALQGDDLLHLQRTPKGTSQAGAVEPWRRCANIS